MSRIRTNTFALMVSFFSTAFLFFLQLKIVTSSMDQTAVGVWTAVTAIAMILAPLAELGMPQVLVRYGAKYDAEERLARLGRLHALALGIFAGGMLAVLLILFVGGKGIASLLGGGEIDRRLLFLAYASIGLGSIRALNNATLRGLRRMPVMAALEITSSVLVTAGYFLLRKRLTVEIALLVFGASSLVVGVAGLVYLAVFFRRLPAGGIPGSEPSPGGGSIATEIRGFWAGSAMGGFFLVAMEQLDRPVLATGLVALSQLAVFQVAARLALFPRRLSYVPFQVMYPEITHKWESPRRHELGKDLELFTKLILGLGLAIGTMLCIFAKTVIVLVATPEYLDGAPVLWAFMAVFFLFTLHQPLTLFLRATGKVWFAFFAEAGWLVVYLGLGAVLLRWFGLPGFVSGQLAGSILVLSYALLVFHRLGLPRPSLSFYGKRIALAAVIWGIAVYLGHRLPVLPWWQAGLFALALCVAGNFLVVRGGYLSGEEEARAVRLLAGRGAVGRVAERLFAWPRRGFRARERSA